MPFSNPAASKQGDRKRLAVPPPQPSMRAIRQAIPNLFARPPPQCGVRIVRNPHRPLSLICQSSARRHVRGLRRLARPFVQVKRGLLGQAEPSLMHGGRTMGKYSEVFVAFDVAKKKHAVAIAEGGRTGEVRFLGDVENSPLPIERTIKRLANRYGRLHVCFEAGPTGYGLCRQIQALGHNCMVVAPALIPKRAGERIKTNRRDAVTLARLHRAGELTGVWTPDEAHEAVRDLVRGREAAADDLRRKRQQLLSFLLRHSRIYSGGGHWDAGASALAGRSEVRACRPADRLSGRH